MIMVMILPGLRATRHLHAVVSKFLIQVVGGSSSWFPGWQSHLDTGGFGTLCLPSGGREEERQSEWKPHGRAREQACVCISVVLVKGEQTMRASRR